MRRRFARALLTSAFRKSRLFAALLASLVFLGGSFSQPLYCLCPVSVASSCFSLPPCPAAVDFLRCLFILVNTWLSLGRGLDFRPDLVSQTLRHGFRATVFVQRVSCSGSSPPMLVQRFSCCSFRSAALVQWNEHRHAETKQSRNEDPKRTKCEKTQRNRKITKET